MNGPSAAPTPRCGVLLVNLGTPDAPTPRAIRRYLAEFLSDPRVIELPRLLWLPILYGFILPLRPRRLVHAYAKIWDEGGSPLLVISRKQKSGVAARLQEARGGNTPAVELAMAYGQPSLASALHRLHAEGLSRLLVLPLFPQYSGATAGAIIDAVFAALRGRRRLPELRTINDYHDDPGYIAALAARVRKHWDEHGRGRHLLLSYHGLPQRYVDAGDPYQCQCLTTASLLANALQLGADEWSVAFQSRFGKAPWIKPYTDARIMELAAAGTPGLDVFCPGFSADCLETLEEVALRYRALFLAHGGREFHLIASLNDDDAHLDALARLVERHLGGWPGGTPPP